MSRSSARSSPSWTGWRRVTLILASSTSAIARLALHRGPRRPRPLPGGPSGQPAASGAGGRAVRRALDLLPETDRDGRGGIYSAVGQEPVTIHREVDGFVPNRLQGALLAEAFRLVGEGVISPQDLDKTVKDGLGLRWSFPRPVRHDRAERAGRHPRLLRPLAHTGFYRRLAADPGQAGGVGRRSHRRPPAGRLGRDPDAARLAAAQRLARPPPGGAEGAQVRRSLEDLDRFLSRRTDQMAKSRKIVITCAVTGAIHTPSMSPHLPVTAAEIAEAAIGAAEAGAAIVHLARPRPGDRQARPDAAGLRAVPQGDQAALELRREPDHRRRPGCGSRSASCRPRPSSRRSRR